MKLEREDEDTIVLTMDPPKAERASRRAITHSTASEAQETVAVRFTRIGDKRTKVEYVSKINLGSRVNKRATRVSLERDLDEASEAQRYFARLIELHEMTKEVGEVLGADLVWDGGQMGGKNSRKDKEKHVDDICNESETLLAVKERYPWLTIMLKRMRVGDFATNRPQNVKLECVTEIEARIIGNNLMPCLKSRKTARAGVEQWAGQNRAVQVSV